jgi:hypothetical protein
LTKAVGRPNRFRAAVKCLTRFFASISAIT